MIQNSYNNKKETLVIKLSNNKPLPVNSKKENNYSERYKKELEEFEKKLNNFELTPAAISLNNNKNNYIKQANKIIFNEFCETDYCSLDLIDLNEKYAISDNPNEKILSDIEWAIDKLTLEDLIISSEENHS